jgi:hypothetical protein
MRPNQSGDRQARHERFERVLVDVRSPIGIVGDLRLKAMTVPSNR